MASSRLVSKPTQDIVTRRTWLPSSARLYATFPAGQTARSAFVIGRSTLIYSDFLRGNSKLFFSTILRSLWKAPFSRSVISILLKAIISYLSGLGKNKNLPSGTKRSIILASSTILPVKIRSHEHFKPRKRPLLLISFR